MPLAMSKLPANSLCPSQIQRPFVRAAESCLLCVTMQDGDAVVIFNFRADRVVELSKALEYKDFDKFDRKRWPAVSLRPECLAYASHCDALPKHSQHTLCILTNAVSSFCALMDRQALLSSFGA